MDLSDEIEKNNSLLIVLEEGLYEENIGRIMQSLDDYGGKICYVCLNKTFQDVIEDVKKIGIDPDKFIFIDVLSSHYKRQSPRNNCLFVSAPSAFSSILEALEKAILKMGCKLVVFDTFSTLLVYKENFIILKFAHKIIKELFDDNVRKIMITLKGGEILEKEREELIRDIAMFVDLSISFENIKKKVIKKWDK